MAVNAQQVLVGSPDQMTTGAVLCAPLGTTMPTSALATLTGFTDAGYVSSDGLTLAPDYSPTNITEWGGSTVRTILESFTGEISWTFIQTGENELKLLFGEDYVTATAANNLHGAQLEVHLGAHLPANQMFAFKMKDGENRILIVAPNAQIVPDGDMSFTNTDPVSWGCKITCQPDSSGESIYIFTDDGQIES